MNIKYMYQILLFVLLSDATAQAMERPLQPRRQKRALEAPTEPEEKFHVKEWKPIDHYLIRFAEPQRLIEFQNLLTQIPAINFWVIEGNVKKEHWPDPRILEQNSEAYHNARELLVNQIAAASPQFKNQLAHAALNNQGHFGVKSLIAYFALALAYDPENLDLANLLKPIIRVLVANANQEQRFEALHTIVKLGIMDPDLMTESLKAIIEAGINPNTPDQFGRNIIQYIEANNIPMSNQLPLDQLKATFSQYPS